MKILKHFNDILFGELVTLMITGDSVTICQGKNSVKYEFPKTFQDYNYLNHTEEMAGWLLAILQEEKIRIRRCRIVLDFGQVYLQTVKLPVMTAQEQQNWVRWEGSQYVPFEPGTYHAVLTTEPHSKDYGIIQNYQVSVAADFSAKWQETEDAALQTFLLVAISLEKIETLQQLAGFLRTKLEGITAMEPGKAMLPVNLLPVASEKEVIVKRGYQTATVMCLLLSVALAVRGGIIWQRTRSAWLEAERQLAPYQSVKSAYADSKKAEYQIRQYQEKLQRSVRLEAAKAKQSFDALKTEYDEESKARKAELDEQRAKAKELEGGVDPELLEEYLSIRKHVTPPVSRLSHNQCSGCNTGLPSAVASKIKAGAYVECETCGRIIIP